MQYQKNKNFKLFLSFVLLSLIGCETPAQNNTVFIPQGYVLLNLNHPKDTEFFIAVKNSLKQVGSLIFVYADAEELTLYREGKRPYPTNYSYTIKANPKISLEDIKGANLALQ